MTVTIYGWSLDEKGNLKRTAKQVTKTEAMKREASDVSNKPFVRVRKKETAPRKQSTRQYPEPEHGTYVRYAPPYKCRCDMCRVANNEYTKQMRETKFERLGDAVEHGKYSTYTTWYCRCEACSAAMREYGRSRRERANALRRGKPRKPPTLEQREARNARLRARRKVKPDPLRTLTPEQRARRNQRIRQRRAEVKAMANGK